MSTSNLMLCRLLDDAMGCGTPSLSHFGALTGEQPGEQHGLLAAMDLARTGEAGRFAALVSDLADHDIAPLSRFCLFLGLTGDPGSLSPFFDAMKRRAPLCAGCWIDLAVLQIAAGFLDAALRSIAMHAALTGRDAIGGGPTIAPPTTGSAPGHINFLNGDAPSFVRA